MTFKKILTHFLLASLCLSAGAVLSGCGGTAVSTDSSSGDSTPTEINDITTSPEDKPVKIKPASLRLKDTTQVLKPQKIDVTPSSDILSADFEDGVLPSWLSSSNGKIISTDLTDSASALELSGGNLHIAPPSLMDGEVIAVDFKFRLTEVPSSLADDSNFNTTNELFHLCAGETGKIPADNLYSARFRVICKDAQNIFIGGRTTDTNACTDFVLSSADSYALPSEETYAVSLYFTADRCYIQINDGKGHVSYGNARTTIKDFRIYVRNGVTVLFDDIRCYTGTLPVCPIEETTQRFLDEGLFTNYLSSRAGMDGLEFERINQEARIKYNTSSVSYNTGLNIDFFSDTRKITVFFKNIESSYGSNYPLAVDVWLNGERHSSSVSLNSRVGHIYKVVYTLPTDAPVYNRITLCFAASMSVAITEIQIDDGAVTAPVPKDGSILVLGDSISEGAECYRPGDVWGTVVANQFNFRLLNQAVAGMSFAEHNTAGNYGEFTPDYILIANGTNSYAMGTETADAKRGAITSSMTAMIDNIHRIFPNAKIFGLLPIWRNDEEGPKCTLTEVSKIIAEVYEKYDDITVIDGYDFIPHDVKYFSNPTLALHANYEGHALYGENLSKALIPYIGEPKVHNWAEEAAAAFSK